MPTRRVSLLAAVAVLLASAPAYGGISFQQEREIGRRFDMMVRRKLPLVDDPEFVAYVEGIGQKIVSQLDGFAYDYKFSVVRDHSINAFAVPGGYVYVNLGLLENAANDDEIAAVLGHEIAHVHAHHMARQQEKSQIVSYASLLAMLAAIAQPALAPLAQAAGQAMHLSYQREFEQEADYLGVRYLRKTRYDPRAMLDFFKTLEE